MADPKENAPIRKLTLPGGLQVGIQGFDEILNEVVELQSDDPGIIAAELLNRVKACNYVPDSAGAEYEAVLLRAFYRKFGGSESPADFEIKKPHAG